MLGKLEVYVILDNKATDQTEFVYLILGPTYVKTHYSIFAVARIWFWKVQSTQIWFWKMQSIFTSHNFHVRKEYDLHLPKPDLATLDGMTTTINIFFLVFLIY